MTLIMTYYKAFYVESMTVHTFQIKQFFCGINSNSIETSLIVSLLIYPHILVQKRDNLKISKIVFKEFFAPSKTNLIRMRCLFQTGSTSSSGQQVCSRQVVGTTNTHTHTKVENELTFWECFLLAPKSFSMTATELLLSLSRWRKRNNPLLKSSKKIENFETVSRRGSLSFA